jgi:hypothetical protein
MTQYTFFKLTLEELNLQRLMRELERPVHIMKMAKANGRPGSLEAWRTGAQEMRIALHHHSVGYDTELYHEAIDTFIPYGGKVHYTVGNQLYDDRAEVSLRYRGEPYEPKSLEVTHNTIFVILNRPLNGTRPITVHMKRKS